MDCLALSVTDGLVYRDLTKKKSVFIAASFGIAQGLFPLIGFALGVGFSRWISDYDHWIAFGLLGLIGGKMIYDGIKGMVKPEARTEKNFTYREVLLQGVADSIDALAVGVTIQTNIHATADYQIYVAFIVIAVVSFLVSLIGLLLGKGIDRLLKGKYEISEVIGGTVLVLLGLLILLQHLNVIPNF